MNSIPRYFAYQILSRCLFALFGAKETNSIMALVPAPTVKEQKVDYILELVGFVNSDNRYKLCVVNRRTSKWAVFMTTPFGTIRTEQLCYAFGWPYESKFDSAIFNDIQELAQALEDCGFNSSVITEAFIDDNECMV